MHPVKDRLSESWERLCHDIMSITNSDRIDFDSNIYTGHVSIYNPTILRTTKHVQQHSILQEQAPSFFFGAPTLEKNKK